jgi:rhodanese-related sulfurtransferase
MYAQQLYCKALVATNIFKKSFKFKAMGFFNNLFSTKNQTNYKQLLKQVAIFIDLRTAAEYRSGHIPGSINVELEKINVSVAELKKKKKPLIAVCRSGNRSGMAVSMLKTAGLEAYNGGAWNDLQLNIS